MKNSILTTAIVIAMSYSAPSASQPSARNQLGQISCDVSATVAGTSLNPQFDAKLFSNESSIIEQTIKVKGEDRLKIFVMFKDTGAILMASVDDLRSGIGTSFNPDMHEETTSGEITLNNSKTGDLVSMMCYSKLN
jgi:hypothetical protein